MKRDLISAFLGKKILNKRPSKETLNHTGLIYLASGINPYENTREAYLRAYESLGIDLLNRVPCENVMLHVKKGGKIDLGNGYERAYLGLYDTFFRSKYPFKKVDDFLNCDTYDLDYTKLITPVPHKLNIDYIKDKISYAGEIGLYYYMLYTTLFMWGVEYLGWEVYMMASLLDEKKLSSFLNNAFDKSIEIIDMLAKIDSPFVFVHDDLADAQGPVFNPAWYDEFIFPRYPDLFKPAIERGKKIIYVADGNMEVFLEKLKNAGVSGVMLETPATNIDAIIDVFGDSIIICGMDTVKLTFGTPKEITDHVKRISEKTKNINGFAICSPGGLHNNIPIENLEAYFDARVTYGFTTEGWRKGNKNTAKKLMEMYN